VFDDADRAALARFRSGDPVAFRELVERYQRPVYNAAFWILRDAEDARDVAQTVFLTLAERADEYDPRHKLFSWIYRMAVNEALNVARRNGREEALDEDADLPDEDAAGPERSAEDGERARAVRGALARMSVSDRTVITLRHFAELPYSEIAVALGIDEKTVKSRLFDARQRLRALLPRQL
jgi:RNA polymerase sigma-70 factor (ECF subfamily)